MDNPFLPDGFPFIKSVFLGEETIQLNRVVRVSVDGISLPVKVFAVGAKTGPSAQGSFGKVALSLGQAEVNQIDKSVHIIARHRIGLLKRIHDTARLVIGIARVVGVGVDAGGFVLVSHAVVVANFV